MFISLNHLKDLPLYQHEKPYEVWLPLANDSAKTNVVFSYCHDIPVTDARPNKQTFDIEEYGFAFLQHPAGLDLAAEDVKTDQGRKSVIRYLEDMSTFMQDYFKADRVLCYDWRVRRARAESVSAKPTFFTIPQGQARDFILDVAQQVHADESPNGVQRILDYLLTDNEKKDFHSGKWRVRLVNLWRPIVPVVENHPLALCDRRTVEDDDWEPVDKVHADWVEEGMYLKRRDQHQWYWFSNQTNEELIAFVVWDSQRPRNFKASTPHCSFRIPGISVTKGPRESIELRFLIWEAKVDTN